MTRPEIFAVSAIQVQRYVKKLEFTGLRLDRKSSTPCGRFHPGKKTGGSLLEKCGNH